MLIWRKDTNTSEVVGVPGELFSGVEAENVVVFRVGWVGEGEDIVKESRYIKEDGLVVEK
jgi:hypothetical protein